MNKLPPIPTPLAAQWQDFRCRYLPLIILGGVIACIVLLWRDMGTSYTLSGTGEGVTSLISSPQPGLIQHLNVMPYQQVQQGEVLALVQPSDPRGRLDLLMAQLQIARLRLAPSLAEQNALDYERVRVELLRTRSELAIAMVNLELLENDVRRNTPLYREKLVSEQVYDLSVKTRDMFKAEVEEKTKAIAEIEGSLETLRRLGDPHAPSTNDPLPALLKSLEQSHAAAAAHWAAIPLTAPISGMVAAVYRHQGENVVEGEPLLMITPMWAKRVVAHLRQPYPVEPQVGMLVKATTRTRQRQQFDCRITQIGAQMEIITNSLAYLRQGFLVDVGLPIVVDLPGHIRVRPGEVVELLIRPSSSSPDDSKP